MPRHHFWLNPTSPWCPWVHRHWSAHPGDVVFGPLLSVLFRQKYPRVWFGWNLELQRLSNRVWIYLTLMDDRYPATDQPQAVQLDYVYPDSFFFLNHRPPPEISPLPLPPPLPI